VTAETTDFWTSGTVPRIAPELLGDIVSRSSDIALVIAETGKILSVTVNPAQKTFGALDHWRGRDLRDFLTVESTEKLDARLADFDPDRPSLRPTELNHSDGSDWQFPIRYTFHRIGIEGAILMLGRDLRPFAEMQQRLVKVQMALERDYEELRDCDARYRMLLDSTRDAVVFVSADSSRITEVNRPAAELLGQPAEDLIGTALDREFEDRRSDEFTDALNSAALAAPDRSLSVVARRTGKRMTILPTVFRAAGKRLILCHLAPLAGETARGSGLSEALTGLFDTGADGIVFTDISGTVTAANDAFLGLIDAGDPGRVKGRPLADFLGQGGVDLKVLLGTAIRAGQMRLYATEAVGETGGRVPVEISACHLGQQSPPVVAFVIRDASRMEGVRSPVPAMGDDTAKSIMELVGRATLRDIVAETTDVVEKMCIETAVELTGNNRVAAAEMLGLSRQSLYVKLRKYGLLKKTGDKDADD
jgi:transcriptional regulator PpsR